jgi:hypothetical protein
LKGAANVLDERSVGGVQTVDALERSPVEAVVAEHRFGQHDPAEFAQRECRAAKVGSGEVAAHEERPVEQRATKVCPAEIYADELPVREDLAA